MGLKPQTVEKPVIWSSSSPHTVDAHMDSSKKHTHNSGSNTMFEVVTVAVWLGVFAAL